MTASEEIVVFGSGGLGDFVATWPYLRNRSITVAVPAARAELAKAHLPTVKTEDIRPWMPFVRGTKPPPGYVSRFKNITLVIHEEIVEHHKCSCEKYAELAQQVTPNVNFSLVDFTRRSGEYIQPNACSHSGPRGLFHVGAGMLNFFSGNEPKPFPIKDWPLSRSLLFADEMRKLGEEMILIAGPDQETQWCSDEVAEFRHAGGTFDNSLLELSELIEKSKFFVGFDSGPTHLAAQLGKKTFALFGPTGPNGVSLTRSMMICTPWGPDVTVFSPPPEISNEQKPFLRWLDPSIVATSVVQALK